MIIPAIRAFILLLTVNCSNPAVDANQPLRTGESYTEADSIAIASKFDLALTQPEQADSLIQEAKIMLAEQQAMQDIYDASYGRYLILSGNMENARIHVQEVLDSYAHDSLNMALAKHHNLMAAIEAYSKNHEASVHHFQRAITLYELHGEERQAAVIKFNLANIFFGRLDYETAYKYSQEALPPLKASKDTANLVLCLSVLSVAETNLDQIADAEQHALEALELAENHPNLQGKLFANYAMGEVELMKGDHDAAIHRLEETITMGGTYRMYQWLLPVRAALLKALIDAENYARAQEVGKDLVEQANAFGNRDVLYSAFKNLALAQEQLGHYARALNSLKSAEELFREHMSETTERVLQETIAQYESEKKNNIILQQENQLSKQQTWTVILVGTALLLLLSLMWIWKSTQQKNKLLVKEKENAVYHAIHDGEEKERKRLAGELHDGIASNLVAIKLKIENSEIPDAVLDDVLPLVSKTHEEIRRTAHNLAPLDFEQHQLPLVLQTFATESSNQQSVVSFHTNALDSKFVIPKNAALILYRAVQELTQNALKHADATAINIQLLASEQEVQITVEDNGRGFQPPVIDTEPHGGLANLKKRLYHIGATLDMDTSPEQGSTFFIHMKRPKI